MAQIIVGSMSQFDIREINVAELRDLDTITQTSTLRRIGLNADNVISLSGTGFTYGSGGVFTGGTLTGISVTEDGMTGFQFNNISVSAVTFQNAIASGDGLPLLAQFFSGNDEMAGATDNDYFDGYDGDDSISGGDGHDYLLGNTGNDTLVGGAGNDHLYGQSANGGVDGNDSLSGGDGSDYIQGNAGNDIIDGGTGSDRLVGGQGNDGISGGTGNDSINGNLGNDTIDGGADNDVVRGGQGNDSIAGGAGNDQIYGDLGADTLSGGTGTDLFYFSGNGSLAAAPDRITDYSDGSDRLSVGYTVSAALSGTAASAGAAATAAQGLFDGRAGNGEVAAIQVGADTYLFYSSNGGATADSAVVLEGVGTGVIGISDFL